MDKVLAPVNREIDKGKGIIPPKDITKGFSYNFLEALGNTKSNLTHFETFEIDEV